MTDSVDTISGLTGLPRKDLLDIWEQVKANTARLDACARHEFEAITPARPLKQRYRCIRCQGEVDAHAHHWHEIGRRQAAQGA